jgi:hypothetical protein
MFNNSNNSKNDHGKIKESVLEDCHDYKIIFENNENCYLMKSTREEVFLISILKNNIEFFNLIKKDILNIYNTNGQIKIIYKTNEIRTYINSPSIEIRNMVLIKLIKELSSNEKPQKNTLNAISKPKQSLKSVTDKMPIDFHLKSL